MDTLQNVVIIVGLAGVGTLWVAAVVGMLQLGWKSLVAPWIDREEDRG